MSERPSPRSSNCPHPPAGLDSQTHRIAAMDALIAATASVHGLAIVTRNATHFAVAAPDAVIDPSSG